MCHNIRGKAPIIGQRGTVGRESASDKHSIQAVPAFSRVTRVRIPNLAIGIGCEPQYATIALTSSGLS